MPLRLKNGIENTDVFNGALIKMSLILKRVLKEKLGAYYGNIFFYSNHLDHHWPSCFRI